MGISLVKMSANWSWELGSDIRKRDDVRDELLVNEMTVYFIMLCALMKDSIFGNLNGTSVVGIKRGKTSKEDTKLS